MLVIVYSFSGIPKDTGKIKVVDVASGSPAEKAGIIVGDIVTKVDKFEKKEITEDDKFGFEKKLQEITDEFVGIIDEMGEKKKTELLQI